MDSIISDSTKLSPSASCNLSPEALAERNFRERERVHVMSSEVVKLRRLVPYKTRTKRMSKEKVIRFAAMYIRDLAQVIAEHDAMMHQHNMAFKYTFTTWDGHRGPMDGYCMRDDAERNQFHDYAESFHVNSCQMTESGYENSTFNTAQVSLYFFFLKYMIRLHRYQLFCHQTYPGLNYITTKKQKWIHWEYCYKFGLEALDSWAEFQRKYRHYITKQTYLHF